MPEVTLTRVTGYRRSRWREDNDAQLFAQSRTLRIRQRYGLDFSTDRSTSPLRAVAYLTLTDFHEVSRAAGPKWTAMIVPTATSGPSYLSLCDFVGLSKNGPYIQ